MAEDPNCIFCKILAGKIPSHQILETKYCVAFMDAFPLSNGHCLVIPKEHCQRVHEVSDEAMAEVGPLLKKVAKAVMTTTGTEDYNVLQNNGENAHQAVHHVHFHIIPKYGKDGSGLGLKWASGKDVDNGAEALAKQASAMAALLK